MSPPSTFLTLMTKDETVQLLSCDSAATCAAEVSDHDLPTPILCKQASADPLVVDHTYTVSLVTQNTSTETKATLVTSCGQPVYRNWFHYWWRYTTWKANPFGLY